jgi:MRG-binding protein
MSVNWTAEMEVSLFYAMIDHKPVGENKHFHMIFIYEKFNNLSDKKLSIEQIWEHLNLLYDLQALVMVIFLYALST